MDYGGGECPKDAFGQRRGQVSTYMLPDIFLFFAQTPAIFPFFAQTVWHGPQLSIARLCPED